MPEVWSTDWVSALDRAAQGDDRLRDASRGRHLLIGQEVVDDGRRTQWHVILDDGEVAVRPGPADAPDLTFSQDAAVARAVATGQMAARTAFVLGHIRVGGDIRVLLDLGPALASLGDVFAAARAEVGLAGPDRPEGQVEGD